jgi:hypothetical protein
MMCKTSPFLYVGVGEMLEDVPYKVFCFSFRFLKNISCYRIVTTPPSTRVILVINKLFVFDIVSDMVRSG